MQSTAPVTISEAEWEVMRVVWAHGSVTSRIIIEVLEDKMGWKESTIKTLIGRLVDKMALDTSKDGRRFIYKAKVSEENTVKSYSEELLSRVCDKQNGAVISHLIQDATLSQEDIKNLQELLELKAANAPEVVPCRCAFGQCDCHLEKHV